MGTALVVFGALLALLLLLLLLLAVPLEADFQFEGIEPLNGQVALRWLFGLVRVRISMPGAGRRSRAQRTAPHATAEAVGRMTEKVAHEPREVHRRVLTLLREAELRQQAYRLAKDVLDAAHLSQLRLHVRLGLGDPADTGRLWAIVGPLSVLARSLRNAEVRVEPAFMEPVLEFRAQGRARLIPLQLLALLIGFVLSPVSIRAWRTLRSSHA